MRLEHDARGLRRFAGGVADVEALDAERMQVLDLEVERIDERVGAGLLRALLGEQLREPACCEMASISSRPTRWLSTSVAGTGTSM